MGETVVLQPWIFSQTWMSSKHGKSVIVLREKHLTLGMWDIFRNGLNFGKIVNVRPVIFPRKFLLTGVKEMKPKIRINLILDISKMPKPLKKEWAETIEGLRKLPNVKIIEKENQQKWSNVA